MQSSRTIIRVLVAMLAVVTLSAAAWAGPGPVVGSKGCNLVGAWTGYTGNDMVWVGTNTEGFNDKNGMMLVDFVYIDKDDLLPGPLGFMSPGRGVWEQTSLGKYRYTWYAYVSTTVFNDPPDDWSYPPLPWLVRVSGSAQMDGCNKVDISFVYQLFPGFDTTVDPVYQTSGSAVTVRMPVWVPPVP